MPVIATAGHVDHGKSTLVRALTGRDPDRWEEEQRRGMTIDLGFAWTDLAGRPVGFVDVPGHERFIKNMLAGVEGIDAALFVVAADEGWMPQSEEHLAVLDLAGITRAVVALTRADLVDEDTLALAALEVEDRLVGTSLAGTAIVPVSAPAGLGMDALRSALAGLVGDAVDHRRPRLWIDRSFSIGGAGTVVTGTLTGGSIAVDDTLVVYPLGFSVRVRGLQTHEESVARVGPGTRTAVNLAGVPRESVTRGAMLGRGDQWATTTRFTADLRVVRGLDEPVRDRGSFQVHIGSGAHPARLTLLEGDVLDDHGAALFTLNDPVPLAAGDRVVLREVGRRAVVGGGVVLDPHPPARRVDVMASLPILRAATTPGERANALLEVRGRDTLEALAQDSAGGAAHSAAGDGRMALSAAELLRLGDAAREAVTRHHAAFPLRAGVPLPELASGLAVDGDTLSRVMAATPDLVVDGPVVHLASFTGGLTSAAWSAARNALLAAGYAPPARGELGLDTETLHALVREGSLVAISDDFVYLPESLAALEAAMGTLPEGFTVGDFRDAMGITRKHAIPLLEWMDRTLITRRVGDGRELRRRRPDGWPPGDAPSR